MDIRLVIHVVDLNFWFLTGFFQFVSFLGCLESLILLMMFLAEKLTTCDNRSSSWTNIYPDLTDSITISIEHCQHKDNKQLYWAWLTYFHQKFLYGTVISSFNTTLRNLPNECFKTTGKLQFSRVPNHLLATSNFICDLYFLLKNWMEICMHIKQFLMKFLGWVILATW